MGQEKPNKHYMLNCMFFVTNRTAHFPVLLSGDGENRQSPREETEERNSVEPEAPHSSGPRLRAPSPTRRPNVVVSEEQMCKLRFSDYTFGFDGGTTF